jgi:hypothetical protein
MPKASEAGSRKFCGAKLFVTKSCIEDMFYSLPRNKTVESGEEVLMSVSELGKTIWEIILRTPQVSDKGDI